MVTFLFSVSVFLVMCMGHAFRRYINKSKIDSIRRREELKREVQQIIRDGNSNLGND